MPESKENFLYRPLFILFAFTMSLLTQVHAQEKPEPPPGPSVVAIAGFTDHDFTDFHEDYKSIKLDTSTLELKTALKGQQSTTADFTREMTQVKWRPNDPIDVYIAIPKGVEKPPVVIYLYGFPADTRRYNDEGWYGRITNKGFAAVAFLPALTGPRFHAPRPPKQNFLNQLPESMSMTVHDLQMVINYLHTRSDLNLDLNRIGIFSVGSGATAAILAAAADSRIQAIDLLNPWGDWSNWLAKSELPGGVYLCEECKDPQFTKDLAPLDPVKWLPTLKTPYIRIRHFVENGETPRICQDHMEAVTPKSAEIVRFENIMEFNRSAGAGRTFDWIKAALKPELRVKPEPVTKAAAQKIDPKAAADRSPDNP